MFPPEAEKGSLVKAEAPHPHPNHCTAPASCCAGQGLSLCSQGLCEWSAKGTDVAV